MHPEQPNTAVQKHVGNFIKFRTKIFGKLHIQGENLILYLKECQCFWGLKRVKIPESEHGGSAVGYSLLKKGAKRQCLSFKIAKKS